MNPMPPNGEFPGDSARTATSDAAFPSRKVAPPVTPPSNGVENSRHDYRITIDVLHPCGGEGSESVSFFASTENDLFAEVDRLRRQGNRAADALRLALGIGLLKEKSPAQPIRASANEA